MKMRRCHLNTFKIIDSYYIFVYHGLKKTGSSDMKNILSRRIVAMWEKYCEENEKAQYHPPLLFKESKRLFNIDLYECYAESEEMENAAEVVEGYILPDRSVLAKAVTKYDFRGDGWRLVSHSSLSAYRKWARAYLGLQVKADPF